MNYETNNRSTPTVVMTEVRVDYDYCSRDIYAG